MANIKDMGLPRHNWDTPPFLLIVSPTLPLQSVDAYVCTLGQSRDNQTKRGWPYSMSMGLCPTHASRAREPRYNDATWQNGQLCSNSVKWLLTNCWKLAELWANNRSSKIEISSYSCDTKAIGYELQKGNWMFTNWKQTAIRRIDSLEMNDSNFAEKLREKCHWHSARKSWNNDKYARTRQGYVLPNSAIDQNQKTTLKTNQ